MSPVWAYLAGALRGVVKPAAAKASASAEADRARAARDADDLAGLCAFLLKHEGMRLKAYLCPAGKPTIGVGATYTLGNRPVRMGMEITEEMAMKMLRRDAAKFHRAMVKKLRADASRGARIAFSSLAFNMGSGRIRKSEAMRLYNARHIASAEKHFKQWRLAGGKVLPGLVKRRTAEWALVKQDEG